MVAAAAAGASTVWLEADDIQEIFEEGPTAPVERVVTPAATGKPQTILLVGDDYRRYTDDGSPTPKGDPTRADTMILVRLDPKAKATTLLSLPRDLLVGGGVAGGGQKLNAAYANGPEGLIRTLQQMLGTADEPFEINRYVSVRFMAFAKAVNAFGCFYTDIDRRYFNDNNPPVGGGGNYDEIDVASGYQRLCGLDSLSYVRFRHLDNTIVREARQTNYIAEARGQLTGSQLFGDRKRLLREIRPEITTNKLSTRQLIRLLALITDGATKPTKRVQLDVGFTPGGDATTTPEALRAAVDGFLNPDRVPGDSVRRQAAAEAKGGQAKRRPSRRTKGDTPATVTSDPASARAVVARDIVGGLDGLPVLYPRMVHRNATYPEGHSRAYDIESRAQTYPWQGYRIVVRHGAAALGQYYGIQGTTWKDPPILDLADDRERLGGRTFLVQYDGRKIRRMMLQTRHGTYWVSNSLNDRLSNAEMRAIAKSLVTYR